MNRIYTIMMVGLIATVVLAAGCKREYGTVTLGANIDNGRDSKVYIDNLTPCWHNNDLIRVNNQTCTTSAALGSSAQITDVVESSHYRAIYPADIVGDVDITSGSTIAVTLPRVQQYEVDSRGDQKVKVPMGACSSNETLTFHNLCSVIKVVVSSRMVGSFPLDSIVVSAGSAHLSGLGNATVSGRASDAVTMMSSSASHEMSLTFPMVGRPSISNGDRESYVYYIVVPEFAEDDVTITLCSSGSYASFEKTDVSLLHNRMATVALTVEGWDGILPYDPTSEYGILPGLFSVSASQQVRFSQGNLLYQASTDTWRFADHQYDYVGDANSNISSTYSGWIDLFGWGTGNSPTLASYEMSNYGTFVDWGSNAISNGGNTANSGWRTLTREEWSYLFNSRANASSKYGTGNINGVGGMIILPDSWTRPSGCTFNAGLASSGSDWAHNIFTLSQWAAMEAAGAVFLPAAGCREGTNVVLVGERGYYWSSSPSEGFAYSMRLTTHDLYPARLENRWNGFAVRPVRDVE